MVKLLDLNTEYTWRRGDIVIHWGDAKEPRMLMKIIGFTRKDNLAKCQYVSKRHKRTIYPNGMQYLLYPKDFGLDPDWGLHTQERLDYYQQQWELARFWNYQYQPGLKVRTTSADGGFETITKGLAKVDGTGSAKIYLERGGNWLLKFVEPVLESQSV